jgi:hypothetical protein
MLVGLAAIGFGAALLAVSSKWRVFTRTSCRPGSDR